LDEEDYHRLGTVLKIHPSVKHASDRAALWQGLRDGSIDCIATDHAPHTRGEKLRGVWEASPGAIGVQTSLPLMLNAVRDGLISLGRCVELMSASPAKIYGMHPKKGAIAPGSDADFVLVDLDSSFTIKNEQLLSPNQLSPFDGVEVFGTPWLTVLRGLIVAQGGVPTGAPSGVLVGPLH
jgi:dihydroorotase-like cyclic amidohydrolase